MVEVHMDVAATRVRAPVQIGQTRVRAPVQIETAYNVVGGKPYEGAYEFTPTETAQTLPTENRYLLQNIVINPIPQNYGLITWDGAALTVS